MDLLYWEDLGQLCLDGSVDLGLLPYAQYIKIVDESNPASFSGSSDGFDVDAVVVINGGCLSTSAKIAGLDNVTTPDEASSVEMSVYPNPADQYTTISLKGASANEVYTVQVIDAAGRVVATERMVASANLSSMILNTNTLANGIYQVVATSANERLIVRLAK